MKSFYDFCQILNEGVQLGMPWFHLTNDPNFKLEKIKPLHSNGAEHSDAGIYLTDDPSTWQSYVQAKYIVVFDISQIHEQEIAHEDEAFTGMSYYSDKYRELFLTADKFPRIKLLQVRELNEDDINKRHHDREVEYRNTPAWEERKKFNQNIPDEAQKGINAMEERRKRGWAAGEKWMQERRAALAKQSY